MDTTEHTLSCLFEQLGLESDPASIEQFIASHGPLEPKTRLADASFWSSSQADFIRESLSDDSDWAEVVDQLNTLLRS